MKTIPVSSELALTGILTPASQASPAIKPILKRTVDASVFFKNRFLDF